ncbi:MAG: CHRD domain-containing protein [Sporichthyaceae bacterium]
MRIRVVGAGVASIALASGLVVSSLGGTAVAGHENTLLTTTLKGQAEVPDKGDPDGRGTAMVFGIDGDKNTLCYALKVSKIKLGEGVAAHIHKGKAGKAGPVVALLAAPGDGDAADCLTPDRVLPSGDKALVGKNVAQQILRNPSNFYVNVHNSEYPGGAIRGQLARK